MHHIPFEQQGGVLAAVARSLREGGICLVKDIATTPAWKHRVNALHDRIVAREETYCRDPAEMAALAGSQGLELREARRLAPRSPYPHYLLRLVRVPTA
jgi:hypothetical protein